MNNFTTITEHMELWSLLAGESFTKVIPTSIRGYNDQRGDSGNR